MFIFHINAILFFFLAHISSLTAIPLQTNPLQKRNVPNSDFPGLGIELEHVRGYIQSTQQGCSLKDASTARQNTISISVAKNGNKDPVEQKGDAWKLTADDTPARAGQAALEYILDGREIQLGRDQVKSVMAEVQQHIMSLPLGDLNDINRYGDINYYTGTTNCDPWRVEAVGVLVDDWPTRINQADLVKAPFDHERMAFKPQVTVAMPWASMWEIFKDCRTSGHQWDLLLNQYARKFCIFVTPDYFQTRPLGISTAGMRNEKDVLGFLSLLLRFAKASTDSSSIFSDNSAGFKSRSTFMPRTEWRATWGLVKQYLPQVSNEEGKTLYDLAKTLACWKNGNDMTVSLDTNYCIQASDGTIEILDTMDNNKWTVYDHTTVYSKTRTILDTLTVKDWINSITADDWTGPDSYTQFDKRWFDGSIGGYGSRLEVLHDSDQLAPLWEFRGMEVVTTKDLVNVARNVEEMVIELQIISS